MRASRLAITVGTHFVLVVGVLFALLPILWIGAAALQPPARLYQYPPRWIPETLYLENFSDVLDTKIPVQMLNSTLVSGATAAVVVVAGSLAAYAFARFRFRFRDALFLSILATQMIPALTKIVPLYLMMQGVGGVNTRWSLVLVYVGVSLPFGVWILTGFFEGLPKEIEEAAYIDGASRVGAFFRIALPLALPGLAAVAILTFVAAWNDFVIALVLTSNPDLKTYQLGLYDFLTNLTFQQDQIGLLNAAAVLGVVPTVIAYLLVQRYFMAGLTAGAVK
ncbi:MAG: carbohydrate ABC transporter permease [Thermomicrobiales bacterium]